MKNHFLQAFQDKKNAVTALTQKALENGWITPKDAEIIKNKINGDKLTIGIIGQIKAGKSTFLNSWIFGRDILPAATTPMTAALTKIVYGEEEKIVVDFFTKDDWTNQENCAARKAENVSQTEADKIKAAKDLIKKAEKYCPEYRNLLGTSKTDTIEHLSDYVAGEGHYTAITKAVTVFSSKQYLKGVEIVDTPGFNDPVVSREERTKQFLKDADVVLLLLYAGRTFDETDRKIIFGTLRERGIGAIIVAINKYDIVYTPFAESRPPTPEEQEKNLIKNMQTVCAKYGDDSIVSLLQEYPPVAISAGMALLSNIPLDSINKDEIKSADYKRYTEIFGIETQSDMYRESRVEKLTGMVKGIIAKEKESILLKKPIVKIKNAVQSKQDNINKEIDLCKQQLNNLQQPDDILLQRKSNLNKAKRHLESAIENLALDLKMSISGITRNSKREMEDDAETVYDQMYQFVDKQGLLKASFKIEDIIDYVSTMEKMFYNKTLKRSTEDVQEKIRRELENKTSDLLSQANDICVKYLPDLQTDDILRKIKANLTALTDEELFNFQAEDGGGNSGQDNNDGLAIAVKGVLGFFFPEVIIGYQVGKGIGRVFAVKDALQELKKQINTNKAGFDAKPYLDHITKAQDTWINHIKDTLNNDLINPMLKQIDDILNNEQDREKQLLQTKQKLDVLIKEKETLNEQLQDSAPLFQEVSL